MNHIKEYKNWFWEKDDESEKIRRFCKEYHIKEFKINDDKSINVNKHVYLSPDKIAILYGMRPEKLEKIPIKFNVVNSDFDCSGNSLTTLENSPKQVNGDFIAFGNNIKDFYGFPEILYGITSFGNNPVEEILNLISDREYNMLRLLRQEIIELNEKIRIRFIRSLNYNQAIRNGDTIIRERLVESLYELGIDKMKAPTLEDGTPLTSYAYLPIDDFFDYRRFKNYKLI